MGAEGCLVLADKSVGCLVSRGHSSQQHIEYLELSNLVYP